MKGVSEREMKGGSEGEDEGGSEEGSEGVREEITNCQIDGREMDERDPGTRRYDYLYTSLPSPPLSSTLLPPRFFNCLYRRTQQKNKSKKEEPQEYSPVCITSLLFILSVSLLTSSRLLPPVPFYSLFFY